jgi:hypothetical protein
VSEHNPHFDDDGNPIAERTLSLICMDVLWEQWHEAPVAADPEGDRLFVRGVDLSEEDPGWDDWRLIGIIRDGKLIVRRLAQWLAFIKVPLVEALRAGQWSGDLVDGPRRVQWARSTGNGPPGPRVDDWLPNAADMPEADER